jgi:Arc/MetJ-type ribon-helix-helix transcriptional regulator
MVCTRMENQKITAHLPKDLLRRAQEATGKGITETLREGLELLSAREAGRRLRALRGKVKFSVDLVALRRNDR